MKQHLGRPFLCSLAVVCTLLVVLMSFACITPCNGSFSSRAGLLRHQNGCTVFRTSQELQLQQRRVTAAKLKLKARLSTPYPKPMVPTRPPNPNKESSVSNLNANCATNLHCDTTNVSRDTHSHPETPTASGPLPASTEPPLVAPVGPEIPIHHKKVTHQPRSFRDELPAPHVPVPVVRRVILHVRDFFRSTINRFNILREYHHRPSYDPDAYIKPEDLSNFPPLQHTDPLPELPSRSPIPPWPFHNMTQYLLMNWFHSGGNVKSGGEVNRLIKEVITTSDFRPTDLAGFTVHQGNKTLDGAYSRNTTHNTPFSSDDWREVSVDIEIPVPLKNVAPKKFQVSGLHYRSITQVIKKTWESVSFSQFHLSPFKRIHVDPCTGKETRIYDEVYTSDAWIAAHDELQKRPNEPGCKLEKVIAGLMFWSDSTHLTNFGTASVWPLYMYFANLSKYIRARPNSGACHHIAYLPYVSRCPILTCMVIHV